MIDPGVILRCALDRDDSQTMALTGLSQARVTQLALQLAADPDIALQYPVEVRRIREVVERGKARRSAQLLRR